MVISKILSIGLYHMIGMVAYLHSDFIFYISEFPLMCECVKFSSNNKGWLKQSQEYYSVISKLKFINQPSLL